MTVYHNFNNFHLYYMPVTLSAVEVLFLISCHTERSRGANPFSRFPRYTAASFNRG
jgi:hypothetical protein